MGNGGGKIIKGKEKGETSTVGLHLSTGFCPKKFPKKKKRKKKTKKKKNKS